MSLFTVSLTGVSTPVEVYGGTTACDDYVLALIGDNSDAYLAASANNRKRMLVSATRYIDRQRWVGEANALDSTTLKWPRDDIEDEDGVVVSDADQLVLVNQAVFELVALLAGDPDVQAALDSGSNVKSMGAGSAKLEFFSPSSAARGTASKLPTVVDEILGRWLSQNTSTTATIIGGISSGTDGEPSFDDCSDYERSEPV